MDKPIIESSPAGLPWLNYVRPLLFLLGLFFVVGLTIGSWQETRGFLTNIKWVPFLIAVVLGVTDHFVVSLVFQVFLRKYGMEVQYFHVGKMYFFGQMAKYIPGRFWNVLYQRSFVKMPGATGSLLFVNVELLLVFIVRNTMIAVALILTSLQVVAALAIYLGGMLSFYLMGRSSWTVRVVHWVSSKIRRPLGGRHQHENTSGNLRLFIFYLAATLTFLSSNFLMMYAAFNFSVDESYLYVAFLGLAWAISVVAVIIPAGMGVREVVFVTLANLTGVPLSLETLTAIAVVYRFWHILQEIGGVLFAMVFTKFLPEEKI